MAKKIGYKIMVFMSKRMLACDEASFLISYKQDQKLGFKRWWQLKMHLLSCHLCRKYSQQIEQLDLSVYQYRESCSHDPSTHHLSDSANAKIQHAVSSELNSN
jgi:hypothetical protein